MLLRLKKIIKSLYIKSTEHKYNNGRTIVKYRLEKKNHKTL